MKNIYSKLAFCVVAIVLLQYRFSYSNFGGDNTLRLTKWDAFGYYMYLPSIFVYHDATELKWLPEMDKKYSLSGGWVYQANKYKNGNYVFKYLGGVAILETPLFLIGHIIAKTCHYEADGFSPPYQYALGYGVLLYCLLSVLLLRKILLKYLSDLTTAITLLLVMLATNIIQYVAIDSAQSHGLIFPLYALMLYFTIKWHEKPKAYTACAIGFIIGLASITRPTDGIILFIPLLWGTQSKESAKEKWNTVKQHKKHVWYALLFMFLGVLPQLVYWQIATGFFVYNVGSKWSFLNPFFSVLFGFESGWFIYTPVTLFFIWGMFYMSKKRIPGKDYPFKNSVIWFCILTIYVIISWFDGNPDATYSCRRLVQSYPVFALPLGALIERINIIKTPLRRNVWRFLFYILGLYLIGVNLFQIWQYNKSILHCTDMNRAYYSRIYLNPSPTPLDMSLLDTNDYLGNESKYKMEVIAHFDTSHHIQSPQNIPGLVFSTIIKPDSSNKDIKEEWLKIEAEIKTNNGYSGGYLSSDLPEGNSIKHNRIRLFNPISWDQGSNNYAFYVKMPTLRNSTLKLYLYSIYSGYDGVVENLKITSFKK